MRRLCDLWRNYSNDKPAVGVIRGLLELWAAMAALLGTIGAMGRMAGIVAAEFQWQRRRARMWDRIQARIEQDDGIPWTRDGVLFRTMPAMARDGGAVPPVPEMWTLLPSDEKMFQANADYSRCWLN